MINNYAISDEFKMDYNQEKGIYEFYEPSLSDIPNASILYKETYTLSAEVNLKTRTLSYRRWQF